MIYTFEVNKGHKKYKKDEVSFYVNSSVSVDTIYNKLETGNKLSVDCHTPSGVMRCVNEARSGFIPKIIIRAADQSMMMEKCDFDKILTNFPNVNNAYPLEVNQLDGSIEERMLIKYVPKIWVNEISGSQDGSSTRLRELLPNMNISDFTDFLKEQPFALIASHNLKVSIGEKARDLLLKNDAWIISKDSYISERNS